MNIAARYFLWMVALFFAMVPVALPIASSPNAWAGVLQISSYLHSVSELILLCITICVISMLDVMETFALITRPAHSPKRLATMIAIVLLGFVIAMMFCFCFWYANFKINPTVPGAGDLDAMPFYLLACLVLSLACRTVYLFAEA